MTDHYVPKLKGISEIQERIQDIHPFLEKLFPVAIVENGYFLVYDVNPGGNNYHFILKAPVPLPIPQGVRAAFGLDCYHSQMGCVVSSDVFDEPGGYVTIFHEFIHCQQFYDAELELKQGLGIARRAQESQDFMWEINYPFPYEGEEFTALYELFLNEQDLAGILTARGALQKRLVLDDYEYMLWQEWKEGFARYIENHINKRLGLPGNHGGRRQPFDRATFYTGGAHFIHLLSKHEPGLLVDLRRLFKRMFQPG